MEAHLYPQPLAITTITQNQARTVLFCDALDNRQPQTAARDVLVTDAVKPFQHPRPFGIRDAWAIVTYFEHNLVAIPPKRVVNPKNLTNVAKLMD